MTSQFSTSTPEWVGIDHVQMAIPVDSEDVARSFYVGVLGLAEVPKPEVMVARGGAWFEGGNTRIHVGVEADFVPARTAHPALTLRGLRDLVESTELDPVWNDEIEGLVRCHVYDPFGNRIELIDADTIVSDIA
jgi:catechol 2,3-dioxygenase-like lactoylglutathione lyase family enzyme